MVQAITDRELARMQAEQLRFLPDKATVRRPVTTLNVAGGQTPTWTTPYVDYPCQASPRVLRQLTEKVEGGRPESGIRWVVVFPWGTILTNDDEVVVTEHGTGTVRTFEVNGVQSAESYETAVSAECLLIA